eukprot:3639285-Alexandrium_andersonii.AAC.1
MQETASCGFLQVVQFPAGSRGFLRSSPGGTTATSDPPKGIASGAHAHTPEALFGRVRTGGSPPERSEGNCRTAAGQMQEPAGSSALFH